MFPTTVKDHEFGKIYAEDYFRSTFNDTSAVIVNPNPMPGDTHQCCTTDNPDRKFYYKIQS